MKNYGKFNFKKYTIYQFNTSFKDGKIKNKLMSFYSWLIRISKNNSINIPKDLLTKLWNRKQSKKASREKTAYKKVNASTVLRWIHKLEKAKLLFIDRSCTSNKYLLNADGSIHPNIFLNSKKCTKKCTSEKQPQTVVDTSVEKLDNVYKNSKLNTIAKDIDIYNSCSTTDMDNLVYQKYIKNQEKVSNVKEILEITEKMFKVMKVRSSRIKGYVMSVLNYATSISKKHAYNYVAKAIENARERYYRERANAFKNSTKEDTFNNYPQRDYSSEDLKELENKLLGW